MDKRTRSDAFLAAIRKHLPKPVQRQEKPDGSIVLTAGDPAELVVRLFHTTLFVFEFGVEWVEAHEQQRRDVLTGAIEWPNLPREDAVAVAAALIEATRQSRLAKYRECRFCKDKNPPERMHDEDCCHGCAEKHLHVVY
jgi:hypothetical protein